MVGAVRQSHRGLDPFIRPGAGGAHSRRRFCIRPAALTLAAAWGRLLGLGCRQLRHPLAIDRLAQGRFLDTRQTRRFGRAPPLAQQPRTLRALVRRHDARFASRRRPKKGRRATLPAPGKPVHQRAMRNTQAPLQFAGLHVPVVHQTRQRKPSACRVSARMRKVVVASHEVGHLAVLLQNPRILPNQLHPLRKTRKPRLLEHLRPLDSAKSPNSAQ